MHSIITDRWPMGERTDKASDRVASPRLKNCESYQFVNNLIVFKLKKEGLNMIIRSKTTCFRTGKTSLPFTKLSIKWNKLAYFELI